MLEESRMLAKGMSINSEWTCHVVKNALSGSRYAITQLRDYYGIPPSQLIEHGAESDKSGEIVNDTPESVERLRTSLLKVINLKFG